MLTFDATKIRDKMYAYIKGQFVHKSPTEVYIEDKAEVAYHIHISLNTYSKIENLDAGLLYTHLNVKEDDLSLYGFADLEEKRLFKHLISVSGIGPNTARIILSSMPPLEIRTAIVTENDVAFKKVKGVGPKTAKRVILDLKDKLKKDGGPIDLTINSGSSMAEEAFDALVALGFQKQSVRKVIDQIPDAESQSVEQLIKAALSMMR